MNAIVPATSRSVPSLIPTSIEAAMRMADLMATGRLMPDHLKNSPGDCFLVVEQAVRWNMSPFAVAMATAIVKGKLCFEGKLVAAAVNSSGALNGRLDYEYSGTGAQLSVTVVGRVRGEDKIRSVVVALASAKTGNEWWTKTPEQMLAYHGARVWARRHTPEVMLGVYSPEEFDQALAEPTYAGTTIDLTPERQTPARPAPAADLPMIQTDALRDRTDSFIMKLAAKTECDMVRKMADWADDNILVQVREACRPDLDKMLTEAIAAARLRCPEPAPDVEDDAGEPMPEFEGDSA